METHEAPGKNGRCGTRDPTLESPEQSPSLIFAPQVAKTALMRLALAGKAPPRTIRVMVDAALA